MDLKYDIYNISNVAGSGGKHSYDHKNLFLRF